MPTFNPQNWQQMNILIKNQMLLFMQQLSNWASWIQSATGLASILNGGGFIKGSAIASSTITESNLVIVNTNLGSVATNQSVACDGATSIYVQFSFTAAITVTLTHLAAGAQVLIRANNTAVGALVLKLAATDPAGAAQSALAIFVNGGAETNMTTVGLSMASNQIQYFSGSRPGAMILLSL
jgi:hypothetical protein